MERKRDALDKLVLFLAKRDGIDKLVKTLQYAGKLGHYRAAATNPELAERFERLEVASGLSRKAFRLGRFLTGFNELRITRFPDRKQQVLSILGYGGEMVYWFFDHLLWLSRIGVLPTSLADRMGFISAFGEAFGYLFFITADLLLLHHGLKAEAQLNRKMQQIQQQLQQQLQKRPQFQDPLQELPNLPELHQEFGERGGELGDDLGGGGRVSEQDVVKDLRFRIRALRVERVMCVMSIVANVSDWVIAMADVEPEWRFAAHPVVLGVSGVASAWAGGYRNWPAES